MPIPIIMSGNRRAVYKWRSNCIKIATDYPRRWTENCRILFALLDFGLTFVPFLSILLILLFRMRCVCCAIIYWKYLPSFLFVKGLRAKNCLKSKKGLWTWTFLQFS